MYADHIEKYVEALLPAFNAYLEASARNDHHFSLKGPSRLASELLYHYRQDLEPFFTPGTMKPQDVGAHIEDYDILGRVVNLGKHTSKAKPGNLIKSSKQISEMLVLNWFPSDDGPYAYFHMRIMIRLDSGRYRDLLDVCTSVINGWSNFLLANKMIEPEDVRFYRYTGDDYFTKERADIFPDANYKAEAGKKFKLTVLSRGYNYTKKSFDIVPFKVPI